MEADVAAVAGDEVAEVAAEVAHPKVHLHLQLLLLPQPKQHPQRPKPHPQQQIPRPPVERRPLEAQLTSALIRASRVPGEPHTKPS